MIRNVRLYDLVTGDLTPTDIAVCGDRIVGTHASYEGRTVIDGGGRIAVPGFIDTHFHVDSSLLTPLEYDGACSRTASRRRSGTRTRSPTCSARQESAMRSMRLRDGHGPARHALVLRARDGSRNVGARLEAADLVPFIGHPKALGLAEFMNFPA